MVYVDHGVASVGILSTIFISHPFHKDFNNNYIFNLHTKNINVGVPENPPFNICFVHRKDFSIRLNIIIMRCDGGVFIA